MEKTMDKIIALAKARGFVYPGSEIYGGLANTWDYGNLGVELKNNVKRAWWQKFIQESLTDVRFKHVEQLIADDRYKQYEIAEMVGYKDFGYYIKVFKKRYGITPNEFRIKRGGCS